MKTYKEICERIEELHTQKVLCETLNLCGIALGKAHYYETPDVTSSYSMGEKIYVWCGKTLLEVVNNTKEYAKSCTWRAKHGEVNICFTRKTLKEYVSLHETLHDLDFLRRVERITIGEYNERRDDVNKRITELVEKCYVPKESKVKKFIAF